MCRRIVLDSPGDIDAAHIRQVHIQQHELRHLLAHDSQRLAAGARFDHRKARLPQHARLGVSRRNRVVDVENRGGAARP
jgi:hypothetical protein